MHTHPDTHPDTHTYTSPHLAQGHTRCAKRQPQQPPHLHVSPELLHLRAACQQTGDGGRAGMLEAVALVGLRGMGARRLRSAGRMAGDGPRQVAPMIVMDRCAADGAREGRWSWACWARRIDEAWSGQLRPSAPGAMCTLPPAAECWEQRLH